MQTDTHIVIVENEQIVRPVGPSNFSSGAKAHEFSPTGNSPLMRFGGRRGWRSPRIRGCVAPRSVADRRDGGAGSESRRSPWLTKWRWVLGFP